MARRRSMQESGDGKPPAPANPAAATAEVNNNAKEDKLSTELPMLRKELLRDEFSQDQRRVIMSQFLLDIARRDNHILKVGGTAQPTLASINISIHPSIHAHTRTHAHTHTYTSFHPSSHNLHIARCTNPFAYHACREGRGTLCEQ
jgi:hypothetical protein